MYDTDGASGSGPGASFQAVTRMELGGHVWTVTTRSRPTFDTLSDKWKSRLIAYDGVGMSLLMTLLTWLLVYGRVHAVGMAQTMNKDVIKKERELRSLFDNASEGIWVFDADKRTIKVNQALLEILGASEDELIGKSVYDFLDKGVAGANLSSNSGQQKSGNNQYSEVELRCADGRKIFCQFNTSRIYDEASNSASLLAMVTDITGRKQLELQKEQYLKFFMFSLDMMCIVGADGFFKKVNPAFIKTIGYTEKEMLEKPMVEILVTDDHPASLDEVVGQVRGRVTQDYENRYLCKDGSFRWLSWRAFTDAADGLVYATARDVTERKRMESALLEGDEAYRCIQATSFDGFWVLDMCGKILDVNERYCEQSGYAREEILGMVISDLEVVESMDETASHIQRVIGTGRDQFESKHRRKDGSVWHVEVSTVYQASKGGRLFAFMRDITERKYIERELLCVKERYDLATAVGKVGTWDWNPVTGELAWSDETFRLMGFTPSSITPSYELFLGLVCTEDRGHLNDAVQAALHGEKTYDLDCRVVLGSGKELVCHVAGRVDFDATGQPTRMLGTIQDVTQRRKDEEFLRKLFTAIEQSPVSVVITDTEGCIQYVNPQFTIATGYTVAEAIRQNPRILQSGQTPGEIYQDLWENITKGQAWHGEILNRRKSGENYWEEVHIAPVISLAGDITHYVCLKTDITEHIKSKATVERIGSFYKMLGDMNSANIHALNREDLFGAACHIAVESGLFLMAWIGLLERESGDVLPVAHAGLVDGYLDNLHININHSERGNGPTARAIRSGLHVACNDIANDPLMRPWREEALMRGYRALIVFPLYQKSKVTGSFNLYFREAGLLSDDVIQLLSSLVADISFTLDFMAESLEREQAQNERQELSLFLETAREDERKHLARELHDELGQTMTALRFDLNWLGDNMQAQDDVVSGKIKVMKEVVVQTVDAIRRISEDLRPGMLDDLGLAAAIENHVTKFAKGTGIACDLVMSQEDFSMDEQVATALFRIVQESLTNVARHSGADLATIQLHELKDNILLVVQDNGRGLPPVPDESRRTFGLVGMRERVKMLGGTLDIFSEPGAGVRVEASISRHAKRNVQ